MWTERVREFLTNFDWDSDEDWIVTSQLKADIEDFRRNNPGSGLPREIFDRIVEWKLRDQLPLNTDLRDLNDQMIAEVTGAAFRLEHNDLAITSRVRAEVLNGLPGVGLGVASAILALYFPMDFGIIDFRVWDEIHERDPRLESSQRSFAIGDLVTVSS